MRLKQITKDGREVDCFSSVAEAARKLKCTADVIGAIVKHKLYFADGTMLVRFRVKVEDKDTLESRIHQAVGEYLLGEVEPIWLARKYQITLAALMRGIEAYDKQVRLDQAYAHYFNTGQTVEKSASAYGLNAHDLSKEIKRRLAK